VKTTRPAMLVRAAKLYQSATKKQKGAMLARLTESLGYTRNSLSWILTRYGKKARIINGKQRIESKRGGRRPGRPRLYDKSFIVALKTLWVEMNFPCGSRMAADRQKSLEDLERGGRIAVDHQAREKLLKVSPSTIDRLLAPEKKKRARQHKRRVKPGRSKP
jgi:hypothetical protein